MNNLNLPFYRRLHYEDTEALGEFFERNNTPSITNLFNPFPLTRPTAASLLSDGKKDLFFGLIQEGRIVAFSMLRGLDDGYDVPSFGLLVDRDFQRKGLGRHLLRHTCCYADRRGIPKIRLSVFADNPKAEKLYQEQGFVRDAEEVKNGKPSYVMFRLVSKSNVLVYASTSCLPPKDSLVNRVAQWSDAGLLNIECSFYPELNEELLKQARPYAASLMLHAYTPFGKEDFCFNLASPSPSIRVKSIDFARERLRISHDVGASYYALHAGFVSDPSGRDSHGFIFPDVSAADRLVGEKRFADAVAEVASYAKAMGITLLIENNVMNTANRGKLLFVSPDDFIRNEQMFLETGSRILLDIGHAKVSAFTEGGNWDVSIFSSVRHLIAGMHVHDNDGSADQHRPVVISSAYLEWVKMFCPEFITLEGRYGTLEELQRGLFEMEEALK